MSNDPDAALSSPAAHSLIFDVLHGEELHPSAVVALAKWALDQSVRVDELEAQLASVRMVRTEKALAILQEGGQL